jgi:hypothetical protein
LTVLTTSCHRWKHRIVVNDDYHQVEIEYDGDIKFSEDETAIAGISPHGFLKYHNNGKLLLAGYTDNGTFALELHENGREVDPGSAEGKELVAAAIHEMINLGFDVNGRMDRLYRKGGYPALLKATDSLESDYVKACYFERILDAGNIPAGMMADVITRVGEHVESDYDKERLLVKVDTPYLKDDSVSVGYLEVVKSMDGDYERSLALTNFLRRAVLPEGARFDSLLQVVGRMDGDYEKGNLLRQIIHKDIRGHSNWAGLIRAASELDGDYDKSNLLVEIGQRLPRTDSLRALYMTAAKTVRGDVDYGRVVRAID